MLGKNLMEGAWFWKAPIETFNLMLLVKTGSHFKLPCFTLKPIHTIRWKVVREGFQREGEGEIPQAKFPLPKF